MNIGIAIGIPFQNKIKKILLKDSFNRADIPNSLGAAETGQMWVGNVGTWGVINNKAYSSSDINQDFVSVDLGVSNFSYGCVISFDTTSISIYRLMHIVFRTLDVNNHLLVEVFNGFIRLYRCVSGSYTLLSQTPMTTTSNTDYALTISCTGNNIGVYVNGGLKINYTLSGGDTSFSTYTKIGARMIKAGAPTNPARLDNVIVEGI